MINMHLVAYTIASAGGLTNQDVPGVTDPFATLQNNHYIFQQPWYIRWAAAFGVNLTDARVNTPYLRQYSPSFLGVVDTAVTPTSLPGICWYDNNAVLVKPIDETAFETTDSAGAGQLYGFLGLMQQQNYNIPSGPKFTMRATATNTGGNKVWNASAMTFTSALPAGRYAVIGMDVVGANLLAARLVFPDSGPRPGIIARTAVSNKPDPTFRGGELGVFGEFESTAQPLLDIFANAAGITQTVYLDLVQIRAGQ